MRIESLLTVEDAGSASDGYEMAGIPDGLGALPAKHGTFTALMNHELPAAGLFSWENGKTASNRGARTVVAGLEDSADGQLGVYAGVKRRSGDAFERAGLTNGTSFVLDAVDPAVTHESAVRALGTGTPVPVQLNEVDWDQSGRAQNREATQDGLTFNRLEDGEFDPRNPDDFYFVTTEGGKGATSTRDGGGLWRLRFEDVDQPELGGELTLLLDGSEAPFLVKPDNMTIDHRGNLLLQEDPGRDAHLARIVAYDVDAGDLGVLARFDPARFVSGTPGFLTADEESSGIVDMRRQLGKGWFLFDAQVHAPAASAENVEKGQLLAMRVGDWDGVYGG